MNTIIKISIMSLAIILYVVPNAFATPDTFPGDTSIYGVPSGLQPNVLVVLDNSGSMNDVISGGSYDSTVNYNSPATKGCTSTTSGNVGTMNCVTTDVYIISSSSDMVGNMIVAGTEALLSNVPTSACGGKGGVKQSTLTSKGYVLNAVQQLTGTGTCGTSTTKTSYATGNYINYLNTPSALPTTKAEVAVRVLKNLISTAPNIKFGFMTFYDTSGAASGGAELNVLTTSPATTTVPYYTEVKKMDTPFPASTSTTTNQDALLAAIDKVTFPNYTMDGQALLEAGRYFGNCAAVSPLSTTQFMNGTAGSHKPVEGSTNCGMPAFGTKIVGGTTGKCATSGGCAYTSPVELSCQQNYVILITDGESNSDSATIMNDVCDTSSATSDGCKDGANGFTSGINNSSTAIAYFLRHSTAQITTYAIGFGTGVSAAAQAMLATATNSTHGQGDNYTAVDEATLASKLLQIVSKIAEVNSTFVAPVVPVSPQNRTYGASRVYMGFFLPQTGAPWEGNLKKYGLDLKSNIKDAKSPAQFATWVDLNNDSVDDNTGATLPSGYVNGSFRSTAESYWSTSVDAGKVDQGGAGAALQAMATPSNRNIYTMVSTASAALSAFNSTNAGLTPDLFGYTSTDTTSRNTLINYIYGYDAFGTPTAKRGWFMGDVLHSRPVVVNYAQYDTSVAANETNCTTNKSMIFVGSNDGMLHAFKDCDGSEAWAFIPPDLLPNLKSIQTATTHPYFVDSSVVPYVYNSDNSGTIKSGDKVVLIFGEGRGGGSANAPTKGAYYALDVTTSTTMPTLLWTLSNTIPDTSTYSEVAETWSEPKIVKIQIGSSDKIAAVFGAGYDNTHEDGRYGATQYFQASDSSPPGSATGSGSNTSSNVTTGTTPYFGGTNQKGRGIYVVDVATLSSTGVPTLTTTSSGVKSATKIWSYVYGSTSTATTDPNLLYSFPSNLATIDANNSGYTTRIYAGDTGGNLWRFDLSSSSTSSWSGTKIFRASPGYPSDSGSTTTTVVGSGSGCTINPNPVSGSGSVTYTYTANNGSVNYCDTGRKIFYAPAVVSEPSYKMIFFGTGDREHPLNLNVVDRMYAIKDKGQTTAKTEADLLDVTGDQIQAAATNTDASSYLTSLASSANFGWFIRLTDTANSGEKVLAPPTVFGKVAYFTTFKPGAASTTTSCSSDVGTATLYALGYSNGNAVINYDTTNDSTSTTNTNAKNSAGKVLKKTDRKQTIGAGIPSGVVVLVGADGTTQALTSTGGNIVNINPLKGGTVLPLYWRQK